MPFKCTVRVYHYFGKQEILALTKTVELHSYLGSIEYNCIVFQLPTITLTHD